MSFFNSLSLLPDDPILHLPIAFAADSRPHKVNLGIGSYKDTQGRPLILTSVKKAEANLLTKELNKEYAPIEGDLQLIQETIDLLFGSSFRQSFHGGIFAVQSLGGTGALRLGGEFLAQEVSKTIFLPHPTWPNHTPIFTRSGLKLCSYRYYNEDTHNLDFAGMCHDISVMPPGSTILLHVNCHNPTGIDPTIQQWQELSALIKKQQIIPFFDFAYQGFGGTIDEDAAPIRYFAAQGHEILVANSFSKNFGLYGERVGMLTLLTAHKEGARNAGSQIKQIIRSNYSNPPKHGAQIIVEILQSETLKREWLDELANMRLRLQEMRKTLIADLQAKGKDLKDWSFLNRQKGFFSFCGLSLKQVQHLIKDYGIYMPANGRINVAGLNTSNLDYVVDAIIAVIQK